MRIYTASSWKNQPRVRLLSQVLRAMGHSVYDFTDPACRTEPELAPEKFPEQFDPAQHNYEAYLKATPEWGPCVRSNRRELDQCDLVVLLLPCGNDSHADWAYGVGRGKKSYVVGHPATGERTPTHLWADEFFASEWDMVGKLAQAMIPRKLPGIPYEHFQGRVTVKAIVVKDNKVLVVAAKRWEIPGGRVNRGETVEAALARELQEELGIEASFCALVSSEQFSQEADGTPHLMLTTLVNWDDEQPIRLSEENLRYRFVNQDEAAQLDFYPNCRRALNEYWRSQNASLSTRSWVTGCTATPPGATLLPVLCSSCIGNQGAACPDCKHITFAGLCHKCGT